MIKMRPYVPSQRVAVRDSIDEDISDDIDDDVFIKDSKTAKLNEEKGLKRPLMATRHKNGKSMSTVPIMKMHRRCCWRCCEPLCYGLAALTVITALISLIALILTMVPFSVQKMKDFFHHKNAPPTAFTLNNEQVLYGNGVNPEFIPCTQISVQKIWSTTFPRMNSESPIRKADLNQDGTLDMIFGFGVDDNIQYEGFALPKCRSPLQGEEVPCEGGVVAVNGRNGELLWQSWSVANVFSLLCTLDINRDGYPECVAAGRLGMIFAINGRNGNNIWEFRDAEVEENSSIVMDLYTINVVRDLDGDDIPEILAVHLEEREQSKAGHIKIITGKTGKVIRSIPTPYREEVFVPVQVVTEQDGTELLMIITGGQNTPGGVYTIRLLSLMKFTSEKEFTTLYHRKHSGIMVPAVLTDITGDGVADVVVSTFNATVYAFDGRNFSILWNYSFPASDSVSAIVPGHFNYDNISDFMIKYNTGPGFPVYYYSQTTILDGRNGQPLLNAMMTDSGGANSLLGGASIAQTFGGDFFLHWQMQCRGRADQKDAYEFVPDSDIILQARADTCRLRYNTTSVVKLYAIALHIDSPGAVLFSTDDLEVHLNRTQGRGRHSLENIFKSPVKHPKLLKNLLTNKELKQKENSMRRSMLDQEVLQEILPNREMPDIADNRNYPYYNTEGVNNGYGVNAQREFVSKQTELVSKNVPTTLQKMSTPPPQEEKDYVFEPSRMTDDYETPYQEGEMPQFFLTNDRPIHLRSKYPGNRDVRSGNAAMPQSETQNTTDGTVMHKLHKVKPISLWDLEREKEERDVLLKKQKYADEAALNLVEADVDKVHDHLHKRERDAKATLKSSDNVGWFLPSISSTGVLLKSLNNTKSSIDFAFILNIRESEPYPPLFMPQDLNCVEEKISAYKSYTLDNQRVLRKQFLKQCLSERLVNVKPQTPKFESQLIITRIGITCSCGTLQPGEMCSELKDIRNQKWTEYMGNTGHGYYGD